MKLYAIVGSPNSRKVMAVLNHLQINVEIEYLDFFAAENQQKDYIALNPNAMVPTLVDGDLQLWESNAINQYLADKAGDGNLYPKEQVLRADIHRWQSWELAHFNQAFGMLAFESVAKANFMDMQGNPALIAWSQEQLARFSKVLNAHLQARSYMVADRVTLADYSMIHVEFFKDMIPFDWTPYPYLNDYFERMRQSPHWLSTAPSNSQLFGKKPL